MKAYKLLHQDKTSHGGCKWTIGEWKSTSGEGELCSEGWLHFYESPLLAVLHNPIHADLQKPRLFEVEIASDAKIKKDGQMKSGATKVRIVKEIPLPEINLVQRTAYAILCAKEVYKDEKWNKWAGKWLSGEDRSQTAANAASAAYVTNAAADAAAYAAAYAASNAAADAAAYAASAAAYAASYAATDDLLAIAQKAMEVK